MTDDLIERLRRMNPNRNEWDGRAIEMSDGKVNMDFAPWTAADALEAQARRIAELTGNREAWKGIQEGTARLLKEKESRIAELEAALEPFADCGVWDGYKDEEVFKLGFKIADLRAARAAYLGVKE